MNCKICGVAITKRENIHWLDEFVVCTDCYKHETGDIKMKIEIELIKNGWIVRHNIDSSIFGDELYFKTINQAIAYVKKRLEKYRKWQDE